MHAGMFEREIIDMGLALDPLRLLSPAHFGRGFAADNISSLSAKWFRKHFLDLALLLKQNSHELMGCIEYHLVMPPEPFKEGTRDVELRFFT